MLHVNLKDPNAQGKTLKRVVCNKTVLGVGISLCMYTPSPQGLMVRPPGGMGLTPKQGSCSLIQSPMVGYVFQDVMGTV